ncbi:TPA: conjugal transfer protein [Citrobacter freundii]|nr:conjugal transfer protein [Citrobacter freundii]
MVFSPSSFLLSLFIGLTFTASVHAAPTSEQATLALLINQLDQLEATLLRAEKQASVAPGERFFFDYSQARADIRAIRTGTEHFMTPSRAQPHAVLPLSGVYRKEDKPQ